MSVDLPEPTGPSTAVRVPGGTVSATSRSTKAFRANGAPSTGTAISPESSPPGEHSPKAISATRSSFSGITSQVGKSAPSRKCSMRPRESATFCSCVMLVGMLISDIRMDWKMTRAANMSAGRIGSPKTTANVRKVTRQLKTGDTRPMLMDSIWYARKRRILMHSSFRASVICARQLGSQAKNFTPPIMLMVCFSRSRRWSEALRLSFSASFVALLRRMFRNMTPKATLRPMMADGPSMTSSMTMPPPMPPTAEKSMPPHLKLSMLRTISLPSKFMGLLSLLGGHLAALYTTRLERKEKVATLRWSVIRCLPQMVERPSSRTTPLSSRMTATVSRRPRLPSSTRCTA
mmetsp:Transcript_12413/g.35272  ORF Transcript_12413/g.35272 Transcript_12413/m.35272 type:complete len:347 (+) Transcript_12413:2736-3776(+)